MRTDPLTFTKAGLLATQFGEQPVERQSRTGARQSLDVVPFPLHECQ